MSAPLRVPGDLVTSVIDLLDEHSGLIDADIGFGLPDSWTVDTRTWVGIFDDSGPARWPIAATVSLRVTVWANGRSEARDIAGRVMSILMTHPIHGVGIRKPSGVIDARDDSTGAVMASFTAQASVRTVTA